jgi:hypothetical protein
MELVPGQWWQKTLAVIFGACTALIYVARATYPTPPAVRWVAIILFVLFTLLSIPALYRKWMSFAEWLSVWVTRGLFSIIYFIVVPFVWVFYKLSGRSKSSDGTDTGSLWVEKKRADRSIEDMERMG